jgi:hypothetical protein
VCLQPSGGRLQRTDFSVDRSGRQDLGVPTISRFMGIVIAMFFDDHGPPHFHARHAD